ncbi:MAG: response regulator [Proteobacteria bacterium]|nr:response regulator [Pseudomonadota bacterium]
MFQEPTVFIVDDDDAIRGLLCALTESVDLPSKAFASGKEFLDDYELGWSGCLLLDVRMPMMSGLELQKELADRSIIIPIIILTAHGDVPIAVQAMKSGAIDFFEKPFNNQLLLDLVQKAMAEATQAVADRTERARFETQLRMLTEREREVLDLVVAGKINKEIAYLLQISTKTVEYHRARLMEKVEASSLVDLIKLVMRQEMRNESASWTRPARVH